MRVDRRAILQTGAVVSTVGLAGCLAFGSNCTHTARFEMRAASDATLVERFSDPLSAGTLGPLGVQYAGTAIEEGEATYRAESPLFADSLVATDTGFYRLETAVTETATTQALRIELDIQFESSDATTETVSGQVIDFEELPAVDQRAVLSSEFNDIIRKITEEATRKAGRVSGEVLLLYPSSQARTDSVLFPDPEYEAIRYEGALLHLNSSTVRREVTIKTFRVQARQIAASDQDFVQYLTTNRLTKRNLEKETLTATQREIIETARSEEYGYSTCLDEPTSSTEFRELMQMIFDVDEELKHFSPDTPPLVSYDGERFLASYGVAVA